MLRFAGMVRNAWIRPKGDAPMSPDGELTVWEWYEAAEFSYAKEHQGCPCCPGRHCVFRSEWGDRVEYYCTACDFSASRDRRSGRCFTTTETDRERPSAVLGELLSYEGELADR
jgi:hypothetical protein